MVKSINYWTKRFRPTQIYATFLFQALYWHPQHSFAATAGQSGTSPGRHPPAREETLHALSRRCQMLRTAPSTGLGFEPAGRKMILMEVSALRITSKARDHSISSLALRERANACAGDKLLLVRSVFLLTGRGKISKGKRNGGNAVLVHSVKQDTGMVTGTRGNS